MADEKRFDVAVFTSDNMFQVWRIHATCPWGALIKWREEFKDESWYSRITEIITRERG